MWYSLNRFSVRRHLIKSLTAVLFFYLPVTAGMTRTTHAVTSNQAVNQAVNQEVRLDTLRAKHPRLFVLDSEVPRIKSNINRHPQTREWLNLIRADAEAMLTAEPAIYKLVGPRLLAQSRMVLFRVTTLAGMYRLEGDKRFAERAKREMLAAADFPDWNPSHFLDTAEMTNAMAIGYDWLFDYLSEAERQTIRRAIVEKGLKPALIEYANNTHWVKKRTNWNQVCNGGLTVGALAIAESEPKLAMEILRLARWSISHSMETFAPDGGLEEGPGYWNYGTAYKVYYLASLETALGTDFGFGNTPGVADTGLFYVHSFSPTRLSFNYADARPGHRNAPQLFWYARKYNQPLLMQYEMRVVTQPVMFHLLWFDAAIAASQANVPPLDAFYKRINVAYFRGSWTDAKAAFVGFKGGANTAGHAHLDLGTFVYDVLGERWATDLGPDDYDLPFYFDYKEKRWRYYRVRTEGQNTLTLNRNDNQNLTAAAPLVKFRSTPKFGLAIADLSAAYAPQLQSAQRGVAFINRRSLLIQDEVSSTNGAQPMTWHLHTDARVTIVNKSRVTLEKNGKRIEARLLEPRNAGFEIVAADTLPDGAQLKTIMLDLEGRDIAEARVSANSKLIIRFNARKQTRVAVQLAPPNADTQIKIKPLAEW